MAAFAKAGSFEILLGFWIGVRRTPWTSEHTEPVMLCFREQGFDAIGRKGLCVKRLFLITKPYRIQNTTFMGGC